MIPDLWERPSLLTQTRRCLLQLWLNLRIKLQLGRQNCVRVSLIPVKSQKVRSNQMTKIARHYISHTDDYMALWLTWRSSVWSSYAPICLNLQHFDFSQVEGKPYAILSSQLQFYSQNLAQKCKQTSSRFGSRVKASLTKSGIIAYQFGTVGSSDGISMVHAECHTHFSPGI